MCILIPASLWFCSDDVSKINIETTSSKNYLKSENKNLDEYPTVCPESHRGGTF